jgi:hypothetical protein
MGYQSDGASSTLTKLLAEYVHPQWWTYVQGPQFPLAVASKLSLLQEDLSCVDAA